MAPNIPTRYLSIVGHRPFFPCHRLGRHLSSNPAPSLSLTVPAPEKGDTFRVLFFGSDPFSVQILRSLVDARNRVGGPLSHLLDRLDVCTKMPATTANNTLSLRERKMYATFPNGILEGTSLASYFNRITIASYPVLDYLGKGLVNQESLSLNPWPPVLYENSETATSTKVASPFGTKTSRYDLGIIASFGAMIPAETIGAFAHGVLCVHPSLLPRWRGPCPIHHTLLTGDPFTGVTIFRIVPGRFDTGPIISRRALALDAGETFDSLTDRLTALSSDLLIDHVIGGKRLLAAGPSSWEDQDSQRSQNLLAPIPSPATPNVGNGDASHDSGIDYSNDERAQGWLKDIREGGTLTTHAPKRDWAKILSVTWSECTPSHLLHLYRALGDRYAGIRTTLNGESVRLMDPVLVTPGCPARRPVGDDVATSLDENYAKYGLSNPLGQAYKSGKGKKGGTGAKARDLQSAPPSFGTVFYSYSHSAVFVALRSDGPRTLGAEAKGIRSGKAWSWVGFRTVTYGGKKMSARDFYNGYLTKPQFAGAVLL